MARNVTLGGSEAGGSFDGLDPATFIPAADDAIVDADTIATRLSAGQSVGITTGTTGNSIVLAAPAWIPARWVAVAGSMRSKKKRAVTSFAVMRAA